MNKTNKTIFTLIIIWVIYTFIIVIIAIKQYFEIQNLQDNNANYKTTIANLKQELDSPEYKAVKKCKDQGIWKNKCIEGELEK